MKINPLVLLALVGGGLYLVTRKSDAIKSAETVLNTPVTGEDTATRKTRSIETLIPDSTRRQNFFAALNLIEKTGLELKRQGKTEQERAEAQRIGIESMIRNGIVTREEWAFIIDNNILH
jgi:hypothetical protein